MPSNRYFRNPTGLRAPSVTFPLFLLSEKPFFGDERLIVPAPLRLWPVETVTALAAIKGGTVMRELFPLSGKSPFARPVIRGTIIGKTPAAWARVVGPPFAVPE